MAKKDPKKFFTSALLQWNKHINRRPMPWKAEKDPYKIWLSEIILQQTRVEQGWDYYNRFVEKFPVIHKLAAAPEQEVFKLWEGLGYYTRCKNLIATAKYIAGELAGKFPETYEHILALKGIGPYTAAAIASFAFNLPHAVLDGNVFRVLSRYFAIKTPIDSTAGKKTYASLANELLDKKVPGLYNQALMDFGATICKPRQPLCETCPLRTHCLAFAKGLQDKLPIKEKTITKRTRWFYYIEAFYRGRVYVHRRQQKDIWENLNEFILIESPNALDTANFARWPQVKKILGKQDFSIEVISPLYRQQLTHQTINGQFIRIVLRDRLERTGFELTPVKRVQQLPFPKFITQYLEEKN